ncbi:MAG: Imm40 family immunity protein [Endozoicomonas sp.]|uniref:Imm40 family immunity protein n=1 Tax=Endozoicomonas sp. TaxID=1892382 RepID=UPI003D9ADA5F
MVWSKDIKQAICCGVSLESLGINNWALTKQQALSALEYFKIKKAIVLGGDVCSIKGQNPELNYDSWHCDRNSNETLDDFSKRSILVATDYIKNYTLPNREKAYFVLVVLSSPENL